MFQRQREELQLNSEEKTLIGTKMIQTGLKDSFGRGGQGKLKPGKTVLKLLDTTGLRVCVCVPICRGIMFTSLLGHFNNLPQKISQ